MRILACADLHGRPERIERIRKLVAEHAPDVVLLPGDLTHAGRGEELLAVLWALPVPVLAVPGNMDGPRAVAEIRERGRLLSEDPVVIAGVPFGGPRVRAGCDVLVAHEPPRGILDLAYSGRHIGSEAIRALILRLKPRVLACGHVHESPGVARLEDTLVVNCTMGEDRTAGALITLAHDDVAAQLL